MDELTSYVRTTLQIRSIISNVQGFIPRQLESRIVQRGFYIAASDLDIDESWIISPVAGTYPIGEKIFVSPLDYFIKRFK